MQDAPHPRSARAFHSRPETPTGAHRTTKVSNGQLELHTEGIQTEVRRDYIHEYYVLVAPKRRDRPYDTGAHDHPLVETSDSPRLDLQPGVYELPGEHGEWLVKVVTNKYPALTRDNPHAYGFQELVIDTPLSNTAFGELPVEQINNVLRTYQERSKDLKTKRHVEYVSIFRNDGYEAGASLAHAHSQIIALPFIPPKLVQESQTIEEFYSSKNQDPYDSMLKFEIKEGSRIIAEDSDWLCFAPYASLWQMEAWIVPKRPVQSLEDLTRDETRNLATHTHQLTSKLTRATISYNLAVEQGITPHQRLAIKVRGRNVVSPQGGFEVATGVIINVIPPESAARWYRRDS